MKPIINRVLTDSLKATQKPRILTQSKVTAFRAANQATSYASAQKEKANPREKDTTKGDSLGKEAKGTCGEAKETRGVEKAEEKGISGKAVQEKVVAEKDSGATASIVAEKATKQPNAETHPDPLMKSTSGTSSQSNRGNK